MSGLQCKTGSRGKEIKLYVVAYACGLLLRAEARGLQGVSSQSGMYSEVLSQNNKGLKR